jgi:hypothetical protein
MAAWWTVTCGHFGQMKANEPGATDDLGGTEFQLHAGIKLDSQS